MHESSERKKRDENEKGEKIDSNPYKKKLTVKLVEMEKRETRSVGYLVGLL